MPVGSPGYPLVPTPPHTATLPAPCAQCSKAIVATTPKAPCVQRVPIRKQPRVEGCKSRPQRLPPLSLSPLPLMSC